MKKGALCMLLWLWMECHLWTTHFKETLTIVSPRRRNLALLVICLKGKRKDQKKHGMFDLKKRTFRTNAVVIKWLNTYHT